MQQFAVKTLKDHVNYLEGQADSPLSPGKFDIIDKVFQKKECQRYAVIIIFNIHNEIEINFVAELCSCHVGNISHKDIEVQPEGQTDNTFGDHGNLEH